MHHLQRISWLITGAGIILVVANLIADLDELWLLSGILLVWAGIVKIIVTLIWTRVGSMATDDHRPKPGV